METLIGTVPDGWDTAVLGEVCDVRVGPSGASRYQEGSTPSGVPIVRPRDICENRIVGDGVATVAPEVAQQLSRYRLAPDDIVCARTGELGRYALVDADQSGWLFSTGCMRIRPHESVAPDYLIYYLCHPDVRDWVERNSSGATIPSINTAIMNSVQVVLPPRTVQVVIGEILGALDLKVSIHNRIARTAAEFRDTLLPLLMSGATPLPHSTAVDDR